MCHSTRSNPISDHLVGRQQKHGLLVVALKQPGCRIDDATLICLTSLEDFRRPNNKQLLRVMTHDVNLTVTQEFFSVSTTEGPGRYIAGI